MMVTLTFIILVDLTVKLIILIFEFRKLHLSIFKHWHHKNIGVVLIQGHNSDKDLNKWNRNVLSFDSTCTCWEWYLICAKMLYGEKKNREEAQIKVVERCIDVVQSNTNTTLHAQFQQIMQDQFSHPPRNFFNFLYVRGDSCGHLRWPLISCPDKTKKISFLPFHSEL